MKVECEEQVTKGVLVWFSEQDLRKWYHRVRRHIKRIKSKPTDDVESEYVDIDVLLNLYIEEFKLKRKFN